jgi:hypothetical protein
MTLLNVSNKKPQHAQKQFLLYCKVLTLTRRSLPLSFLTSSMGSTDTAEVSTTSVSASTLATEVSTTTEEDIVVVTTPVPDDCGVLPAYLWLLMSPAVDPRFSAPLWMEACG